MKTILAPKPADVAAVLLTFGLLLAVTTGCRAFNYTDQDLQKERRLLAESRAKPRGGWSGGMGAVVCPDSSKIDLGKINCPNPGSGICPGK